MIYQPAIKIEVVFSMSLDGTEDVTEVGRVSLSDFLTKFNTGNSNGPLVVADLHADKDNKDTNYTVRDPKEVISEIAPGRIRR